MKYMSKKRVTAILLSFFLAVSALAFSYSEANAASDNSENRVINFLYALDIMREDENTGIFWDETPVKRAEMAEILCKMFGFEPQCDDKPMFSDVREEDRGYVETIVRGRYMSGYGNGIFGANEYVTNEQLVKIFVCVSGAGQVAENMGGYPNGYMYIGRKLGLLKGMSGDMNVSAKRIDVANMIYYAMHADMYELVGISSDEAIYRQNDGETFLTEMLDIYRASGIVEENEATSLNRANGCGDGNVRIGDKLYRDSMNLVDEYLGCDVVIYAKRMDNDVYDIIYAEEGTKNKVFDIDNRYIVETNVRSVKYYENNKIKTISISAVADMIFNGAATEYDESKMSVKNGKIRLIDNSGDNIADVVSVTEYDTYIADRVLADSDTISMKYNENSVSLKESSYSIYKNGERIALEDISDGDVLLAAVSKNNAGLNIIRIEASNTAVVGKVEKTFSNSDRNYVTISGKDYEIGKYCENLISKKCIQQIKAGVGGQFYLDSRGVIAYYKANSFGGGIGYLIKSKVTDDVFSSSLTVKVYTTDGDIKTLTATDKLNINGDKVEIKNIPNNSELMTKLSTPDIVRYSEKDGALSEVTFATEGYDANSFSVDKIGTLACNYSGVIDNKYNVTSDTIVFYVPNTSKTSENYDAIINEPAYYFLYTGSRYVSTRTYTLRLYDVMPDGKITYIVETYDPEWTAPTSGSQFLAVTGVGDGVDEKGEEGRTVYGINESGNEVQFMTKLSSALIDQTLGRETKTGDIIQYSTDAEGRIRMVKIQHDADSGAYYTATRIDPNDTTQQKVYGEAVSNNGTKIPVAAKPLKDNMTPNDTDLLVSNTGTTILEYDKERKMFIKIDFSDILRGDKVFAVVNGGNRTRMLVVYK